MTDIFICFRRLLSPRYTFDDSNRSIFAKGLISHNIRIHLFTSSPLRLLPLRSSPESLDLEKVKKYLDDTNFDNLVISASRFLADKRFIILNGKVVFKPVGYVRNENLHAL